MKYILFFTLVFFISCLSNNKIIDCDYLLDMLQRDQIHRTDPKAIPLMYVCDSLYFVDKGFRVHYSEMPIEYTTRAYDIVKDRPFSDFVNIKYSDSIINLLIEKDKELTLELIDYIQTHDRRLLYNSECFKKALVIFVHTPSELRSKVNLVINNHRNAIPDPTYNHILKSYKNSGFEEIQIIDRTVD